MPTHLLTLGKDPAITYAFMDQLAAARPGTYTASTAHSPEEFETYAKDEKDKIDFVLLGAAQTDEQVANAKRIVASVWGKAKESKDDPGEGKWVLRLPPSLLTKEGKEGGMLRWFLEQVEG
ncbi:hypothetical protein CALVIDRAFT_565537 [Calocera viscosa TUFC12733]|uniref:Uncharacterized protein n=1 Tax=Calocera viscosa (strain TUFC12733) TaxID=1330018 RepID=A0A167KBB9_CALVF|nr:hypothetical protein CALVIDRAFT_565537 [Calocera viscosa TUFC12733]